MYAEIAQLVEHFTRNEGVVGSSPIFSFLCSLSHVRMSEVFWYGDEENARIYVVHLTTANQSGIRRTYLVSADKNHEKNKVKNA